MNTPSSNLIVSSNGILRVQIVCFSFTAAYWLSRSMNEDANKAELKEAMNLGIKVGHSKFQKPDENCSTKYHECKTNPGSYRYPGIKEPGYRNISDSKELETRRQIAKSTIEQFLEIAERKFGFEKLRLNASNWSQDIHVKPDQTTLTREHSLQCTHNKSSSNHLDKRTSC